jgi:PAS domain S-box-containing protein
MLAKIKPNANRLSAPLADHEFRKLAENIPTLCWIAGADGYITWYNPKWYEYTGTTPADMEGWGWQSVHDRKALPEILERWQSAISAARPFEMVFSIRGADGILRPFLTRINPAFDADGTVASWYGLNIDISLQVQAEDAAAKSEAKFRLLADSMPQLVWAAGPDGAHDYHNARWYAYTGAPIGASDGDAWADLVHPADRPAAVAAWHQARRANARFQSEHRLRDRFGAYRWMLSVGNPARDRDGTVTRWYGTHTDIEEIVQARRVSQRSRDELEAQVASRTGERNLLATLVERTDVMVMALGLDYGILAVNRASADEYDRIYGRRPKVGDNLLDLLADQPEQLAETRAAWSRAIAGEEYGVIEARGDPARIRCDYEIKFRSLTNDAGERIGAFQFVTDVTERLRDQRTLAEAQQALIQAQKLEAMGQLTGGVAHDFNNLLTPILGALDMLKRRGAELGRDQRLVHGALEAAERARTLVHRLLAFARRQPLQAIAVDVGDLVGGMADLTVSAVGPTVGLALQVPDRPLIAKADPHQLEMAILNLAVNARDALDGSGELIIAVDGDWIGPPLSPPLAPGPYVRVAMSDTGKGMDEATRARAIEPFFSTKGVGQGTGLGLSMAHGLASQLGGALTIDSTPGEGTCIAIWLPQTLASAAVDDRRAPNTVARPWAGLVLLVDDEALILETIAEMLAELDLQVHQARSPEDALSAIEAGLKPDYLVTDHLMPGMTGVELAHAVTSILPNVRPLIISGYAEVETLDPSLCRLAKPFVLGDLARALVQLGAQDGGSGPIS